MKIPPERSAQGVAANLGVSRRRRYLMANEWKEPFCPMCRRNMGKKNILIEPNKPWTKTGEENLWEKALAFTGETHFGVVKSSEGRGTMQFVRYYEIEEDSEGYFPPMKAQLLAVIKEWLDKGWLTREEVEAAIA